MYNILKHWNTPQIPIFTVHIFFQYMTHQKIPHSLTYPMSDGRILLYAQKLDWDVVLDSHNTET